MSGPIDKGKWDGLEQKRVRLRRRAADLASSVAATEEKVADTLEQVAENRPPQDAERLRFEAEQARRYAAKERERSKNYKLTSGGDGSTP